MTMMSGPAPADLARQARRDTGWDKVALVLTLLSGLAAFAPWLDSGYGEVATGWSLVVGRVTLALAGIVVLLLLSGILVAGERLTLRVMALFGAMLNAVALLAAGLFALFGLALLEGLNSLDSSSASLEVSLTWGYWIALVAASIVPFVTIIAATRPYRNWIDTIPAATSTVDLTPKHQAPTAQEWPIR